MQSSMSTYFSAQATTSLPSNPSNSRQSRSPAQNQNQITNPTQQQEPSVRPRPNDSIDWARLQGFEFPPPHHKKARRTPRSRVWDHGWRIHHVEDGVDYWLCRKCHLDRVKRPTPKGHVLVCTKSTSSIISHLKLNHGIMIGECEPTSPLIQSQPQSQPQGQSRSQCQNLPQSLPAAATVTPTAHRHRTSADFDSKKFLELLVRLFTDKGMTFAGVENEEFREMMIYCNPRCKPFLPSAAELHEFYVLNEPRLSSSPLGNVL